MNQCDNCNCNCNQDPTPDQIAFAVKTFAEAAVLLKTNEILQQKVVDEANRIAMIALKKLEKLVKEADFGKKDDNNNQQQFPQPPNMMPPVPMPPVYVPTPEEPKV